MDEPEKRSGSGRSGTTTKDYLFLGAVFFLLATVQKQKKKKKLINCAIFNGRQRCARQIPSPPPLQHHRSIDPCGGSQVQSVECTVKKGTTTSFSALHTLAIKTQECAVLPPLPVHGSRCTHHSQQRKADTKSLVGRSLTASTA